MQKPNVAPRPVVRHRPQMSLVALDDRTADRQTDAHAVRLGRIERIEQVASIGGG